MIGRAVIYLRLYVSAINSNTRIIVANINISTTLDCSTLSVIPKNKTSIIENKIDTSLSLVIKNTIIYVISNKNKIDKIRMKGVFIQVGVKISKLSKLSVVYRYTIFNIVRASIIGITII